MVRIDQTLNITKPNKFTDIYDIKFVFKKGQFKQYTVQNIITFDTESSNGFKDPVTNICEGFDQERYDRGILKTHSIPKSQYDFSDPDVQYMVRIDNSIPVGLLYIWQCAIEDGFGGIKVFIGRTWDEYLDFQLLLTQELKRQCIFGHKSIDRYAENFYANVKASDKRVRIIVFTHNLGHDWQFLRSLYNDDFINKRTKKSNVFARKPRRPIKAHMTLSGVKIEYRDTLSLAQMSLKDWAHTNPNCPIEKLDDFDYLTIKTPLDKLTDTEIHYSINDVVCLVYCIEYERDTYKYLEEIPLTNTGKVRRLCRERVAVRNVDWSHTCASITKLYTPESFANRVMLYQGGYTHACCLHIGKVLDNCVCFDFASSYPSALCNGKYPVKGYQPCSINEFDELEKQDPEDPDYRWWAIIKLKNVRAKLSHSYWSLSKSIDTKDPCVDNGRIRSASEMTIYATDLDWYTFKKAYRFDDDFEIKYIEKGEADYLPEDLILLLLECFGKKTFLKGDDSKIVEYNMAKIVANSIYGVFVFKLFSDDIYFTENGWEKKLLDDGGLKMFTSKQDKIKDIMWEFGFFDLGLICSAIARKRIWDFISHFDDKVWYIDTDSIKGAFNEEDIKWIEDYNKWIEKIENDVAAHYNFDPALFAPKTAKGATKRLGIMEREPDCALKTLGAKRYIAKHGDEIECTIAGLPKSAGAEKIKTFDDFSNETLWTTAESKKACCYYNDNQGDTIWYGRDGQRYESSDRYGVCIKPVTFDLSMSGEFITFLTMLANGKIDDENQFFDDTPNMLLVHCNTK